MRHRLQTRAARDGRDAPSDRPTTPDARARSPGDESCELAAARTGDGGRHRVRSDREPSRCPVPPLDRRCRVAAASAFLLDDSASVTLAASPTSLPARRLYRVAAAAIAVGLWWAAAVSMAIQNAGGFPLRGRALELAMFVTIALAASATATTIGDRMTGGIAGAVVTIACYSLTLLPSQPWLPFPSHPDAPGATPRLLAVLICATAALTYASRDPATRRSRGPHRSSSVHPPSRSSPKVVDRP